MYAFIEGQVCEKTNGSLVLLAAGVGWQISCSNNTLQAAPAQGETMRCYTVLNVREDAMELYGFATKEEKRMFQQLTSVSGVGAKTALGLLGAMPLRDLNLAILLGAVNALASAADCSGAEGEGDPGGCVRPGGHGRRGEGDPRAGGRGRGGD